MRIIVVVWVSALKYKQVAAESAYNKQMLTDEGGRQPICFTVTLLGTAKFMQIVFRRLTWTDYDDFWHIHTVSR